MCVTKSISALLLLLTLWLGQSQGHGRLLQPPCRASMWRLGYSTKPDYNDHQLFCGGANHQKQLGGKCGVCGDAYDENVPRTHEIGGPYYKGILVANYTQGQTIDVQVEITANHLGYFEFRVCPVRGFATEATQDCLDKHVLRLGRLGSRTRHRVLSKDRMTYLKVRLPKGLVCDHCVFQWKWVTGNNWSGCTGPYCAGIEHFFGCADIAIRK